jgi:ribosome-associated translation inhibitor RaiA
MITQVSGIDMLKQSEKDSLQKLMSLEIKKLNKKFKDISSFYLHVKEHKKEKSKPKYSFHSKIIISGHNIETESFGWDYSKSLRDLFDKIEEEINHKFLK